MAFGNVNSLPFSSLGFTKPSRFIEYFDISLPNCLGRGRVGVVGYPDCPFHSPLLEGRFARRLQRATGEPGQTRIRSVGEAVQSDCLHLFSAGQININLHEGCAPLANPRVTYEQPPCPCLVQIGATQAGNGLFRFIYDLVFFP